MLADRRPRSNKVRCRLVAAGSSWGKMRKGDEEGDMFVLHEEKISSYFSATHALRRTSDPAHGHQGG